MVRLPTPWSRLRGITVRRPSVWRAGEASVAAVLAWLAVLPLGGLADDYPYYAPLGAVVAVSGTVVGSIRGSVQGVAAIGCGAVLSLTVLNLHLPVVIGIAVVVAVGSLVGGWWRLGEHGSWVPWSAVFVLVGAGGDPAAYAVTYGSLVSLGAVVGIAVTLVMPPLPLSAGAGALERLGRVLADQLDDLAEGLCEESLDAREWARRRHATEPASSEVRRMVGWATEARRVNWRQRHWARRVDAQYRLAVSLQELTFLVEHLTGLLTQEECADAEHVALGPSLRPPTAAVLSAVARLLRAGRDDATATAEATRALDDLVDHVRALRGTSDDDLFSAGAVVTVVRRALTSLAPGNDTSDGTSNDTP